MITEDVTYNGYTTKTLTEPEKSRTYIYPDNQKITVYGVTGVKFKTDARRGGSHRLDTKNGKYYVSEGWLAIQIDAEKWSF